MRGPDAGMGGDLGHGDERPDPEAPVRLRRDAVQSRNRLQVHQPRGLDQVLLQVVEEVDPAGLPDAARLLRDEAQGLGDARGPRELEPVHGLPPFLRLRQGGQHPVRRHRELPEADPRGVEDGVGDGGQGGHEHRLGHAGRGGVVPRVGPVGEDRHGLEHVRRAEELVGLQVGVHHGAHVPVEGAVLEQGPRGPLDLGADELVFRREGVDRDPAVVHAHHLEDADHAGLHVHLHLRELRGGEVLADGLELPLAVGEAGDDLPRHLLRRLAERDLPRRVRRRRRSSRLRSPAPPASPSGAGRPGPRSASGPRARRAARRAPRSWS